MAYDDGMKSNPASSVNTADNESLPVISNTVALIGVVLAGIAVAMVAVLFILAEQQPDDVSTFRRQLGTDTPAQLRLLILGCTAAVLTVVAFALCAVGLLLPNRPRLLAVVGVGISLLLLLGVFGVVVAGALMNPPPAPEAAANVGSAEEPEDIQPNAAN